MNLIPRRRCLFTKCLVVWSLGISASMGVNLASPSTVIHTFQAGGGNGVPPVSLAGLDRTKSRNLGLHLATWEGKKLAIITAGNGMRGGGGKRNSESGGGNGMPFKLTTKMAVLTGMLLAFNSGYINGACLSGILSTDNTKQAAAAVTGAWTNSALGLASGQQEQFLFNFKCILSYVAGSTIAGVLNPTPVPFEMSSSTVGPAFGIGAALMYASSRMAAKRDGSKSFIYLAAVANGVQNSVTSVATANLCRTTHFSGISSDMGSFLGQALRGNYQNVMKLKVFAALAISFWLGGLGSYFVTTDFPNVSLLFSAVLYLALAMGAAILA